jgi:hypothetical protein
MVLTAWPEQYVKWYADTAPLICAVGHIITLEINQVMR